MRAHSLNVSDVALVHQLLIQWSHEILFMPLQAPHLRDNMSHDAM